MLKPVRGTRAAWRGRLAILALSAAVGTQLAAPAARADNWGSTTCGDNPLNCISLANNNQHSVRFVQDDGTQIPGIWDATQWVLSNVYDPTDLHAYRDDGDTYPDVLVHDFNYGAINGVTAWVVCDGTNTGTGGNRGGLTGWCRGQHLRFNAYYFASYYGVYDTDGQRRNMACHETGHTVGLRHRTDTRASCMWTYAGDGGASTLSTHDWRDHININPNY